MSLPAMMKRSARLRASVSVVNTQPLDWSTRKLRYCASLSAWSTTPPPRSAIVMMARMPSTSVPKTAEDRQTAFPDQFGGEGDRLVERNVLSVDLRIWLDERALETGNRLDATVLENLQPSCRRADFKVIAQDAAKRAGDVLKVICAVSRLFGFQILHHFTLRMPSGEIRPKYEARGKTILTRAVKRGERPHVRCDTICRLFRNC